MTTGQPSELWQRVMAESSLLEAMARDEEIEDIAALTGDAMPQWVRRLAVPEGWQVIRWPRSHEAAPARIAVWGPRDDGGWEATETIGVFGFTGWPGFYDVYRGAARTLGDLGAADITTTVLAIPPRQWVAAIRSSGSITTFDRRQVWAQLTNYVAGSEQPHAGRLIVHSLFVDVGCRARLAETATALSDAVLRGFVAAIGAA